MAPRCLEPPVEHETLFPPASAGCNEQQNRMAAASSVTDYAAILYGFLANDWAKKTYLDTDLSARMQHTSSDRGAVCDQEARSLCSAMQASPLHRGACHSVNGTQVQLLSLCPGFDLTPEALNYCYEFARRLLFTGQSTTGDFQISKVQKLVVLQGQGSVPCFIFVCSTSAVDLMAKEMARRSSFQYGGPGHKSCNYQG
ncbi:hypothetical protein NA56DRAFT_701691 [Hyaloscypha hepaticicola]|uniref:Uncharacterized protein n=1 Tax=Hyaloscypha hepaticicola TaxID=2082293 RepID=A0A2J6QAV4_9HELO|nr:hypothetical protein NA56DRAFT_701691 [Hyaloscypha hepaticicola]